MNTTSRPLRRLALLTASLAVVATAVLAPSAHAGDPGINRPTGAELPQVVRVDDIFGHLEGGRREMIVSNRLEVANRTCVNQGPGKPAKARFSSYTTADGQSPYFSGQEDPTFVLYQFKNKQQARAGFRAIADFVARCEGRRVVDGTTSTVERVGVPALGRRQVGYRTVTVEQGDRREDLEVYVLQGKRVERSWIQLDEGRASVPHVIAMAKLLRETSRRR